MTTPSPATLKVGNMSERVMERLAYMICGFPIRIFASNRIRNAAAIQCRSKTVILQPHCGIYDILICAAMLRVARKSCRWKRAPKGMTMFWFREARTSLETQFSNLDAADGVLRAMRKDCLVDVHAGEIELAPLKTLPGLGGSHWSGVIVPDLGLINEEAELRDLAEAIEKQQLPLQHREEMPNHPVATLPMSLKELDDHPTTLDAAAILQEPHVRKYLEQFKHCYMRSSEGLERRRRLPRASGVRLDPSRLATAAAAIAGRQPPKVFRPKLMNITKAFCGDEHLVVYGLDLNSFRRSTIGDPVPNRKIAVAELSAIMDLGLHFVAIAFADRLVPLRDGRIVYLHVPILLKDASDPADFGLWRRIERLLFTESDDSPHSASLQSLHTETMCRHLDRGVETVPAHNLGFFYISTFHKPDVLYSSVAKVMDHAIQKMAERHEHTRWHHYLLLSKQLVGAGRRGGWVNGAMVV
jgi:hypothetical protein